MAWGALEVCFGLGVSCRALSLVGDEIFARLRACGGGIFDALLRALGVGLRRSAPGFGSGSLNEACVSLVPFEMVQGSFPELEHSHYPAACKPIGFNSQYSGLASEHAKHPLQFTLLRVHLALRFRRMRGSGSRFGFNTTSAEGPLSRVRCV